MGNMGATTTTTEVRELAQAAGVAIAQVAREMGKTRTWLSLALAGERAITSVQLAEVVTIIDRLVR